MGTRNLTYQFVLVDIIWVGIIVRTRLKTTTLRFLEVSAQGFSSRLLSPKGYIF